MKRFFHRLFLLYPGEGQKAAIFSSLAYFWSITLSSGVEYSDALFLVQVGAPSLPIVYGMTAVLMLLLAFAFLHSVHRIGTYATFVALGIIGITFYGGTALLLGFHLVSPGTWFWYAFKVFGFIFFSFGLTSYWTFVDEYHHIRDSKRIYIFFSTLIFFGMATTGVLMRSGLLSLVPLLATLALIITCALAIGQTIRKRIPLVIHEENEQESARSGQAFSLPSLVKAILTSRFTLALLVGNLLMQLLTMVTEFNYFSAFDEHFGMDDLSGGGTNAELTKFMGKLVFSVSVFNLFFGFFLYSRLAKRLGVGPLLSVTPTILVLLFTGWSFNTSLLFPVIGFFVTDGTIWLLDDNNFNLMLNAVPFKLKYKIRIAIEAFFEPVGILISAFLLYFFRSQSKLVGLTLALCWLGVTVIIRNNYLSGLFSNLSENAIHFTRTVKEWLGTMRPKVARSAEYRLLAIVKKGEPDEKVIACEGLLAFEDPKVLEKMLRFAREEMGPAEKLRLLEQLGASSFAIHPFVLNELEKWLRETSAQPLHGAIQFYFASKGLLHPEKVLGNLQSPHLLERAAAIAALKKSGAALTPQTHTEYRLQASQRLQELLSSSNTSEVCIGLAIFAIDAAPLDIDFLIPYLKHPSSPISRKAAEIIATIIDRTCKRHGSTLLDFLSVTNDPQVRAFCLKALGKLEDFSYLREIILASQHFQPKERRIVLEIALQMGRKTVPMLLQLVKDRSTPDRCRLLAGKILGELALPQLRAHLSEMLTQEVERAYFYYFHAHTLQDPDHDLTMLTDTLLLGYQSSIDFMIQLLGVSGEVEDEELLVRSLRSHNPKMRNQAVEAIERSCEPQIFALIQPLIDDIPTDEKIQTYLDKGYKPLQIREILDRLDESSAQVDQIIAATYKYRLHLPGWDDSLRKKMSGKDEIFHHFAYELLEGSGG